MSIIREPFGATQAGEPVERITMTNESGASVSLITYGGTLVSILVPDRHGIFGDVCLGYTSIEDYQRETSCYLGALIGRHANRIARGHLEIDGHTYQLACNEGANHLHGGNVGFDKRVWRAECAQQEGSDSVTLRYVSPDGEENFPGTLEVSVTYAWNDDNELSLHYRALSDRKTIINLTNHAYFNLAGHNAGTIENHLLSILADHYTPADAQSLPTGEIAPVEGTPFDLRQPRRIGDMLAMESPQLSLAHGYDHNFVLADPQEGIFKASELYDPATGRVMETFTDLPGIQLYTANKTDIPLAAKDRAHYGPYCSLCLETQYFPDTPHHSNFPSVIFDAGQPYEHTTVYKFGVRDEA